MSETVAAVARTALMLFLMLSVGFVARKANILGDSASKVLSKLIICVGQPFMIIGSQLGIEYSGDNLRAGLYVLALAIAAHAVIAVVAFAAARFVRERNARKIFEFSVIFANCGFMGFPLLRALLGDIGVFWGSFYVIAFNLFTWTWGMVVLGRGRTDIKISPLKMIVNYGTLPCVVGFALFALQIPVPAPVAQAVDYLGGMCTPVSMLITGMLLATTAPRSVFCDRRVYGVAALKLVAVPAVVLCLATLLGFPAETVMFLSIMAAMPVASNTVMFAELYDIEPRFAACSVGLTTLLSTATLPLVTAAATALLTAAGRS